MASKGRTLTPKDLFSEKIYHYTLISYLIGFLIFIIGIIIKYGIILKIGAGFLLISAVLYSYNTNKTILHKAKES